MFFSFQCNDETLILHVTCTTIKFAQKKHSDRFEQIMLLKFKF